MTQFVRNENGDVIAVTDDDPRATGDAIGASLKQQGMYQSPEGWAIVTGSPGGQMGGAPRIITEAGGKQPPADILAKYPPASPQENAGFRQQAAKYRAGEGKGMSLGQAALAAVGSYFGGQAIGGLLGGAGAVGGGASTLGDLSATDLGGGYGSIGPIGSETAGAAGFQGAGADAIYGATAAPAVSGVAGGMAAPSTLGGIGAGTVLSGAGTLASLAGGDGVQAGVDAANSGSKYSLNGIGPNGDPTVSGNTWDVNPSNFGSLATSAGKTALSRILDGTATASDYLSVGGAALPGVLGAISSSNQTSKLSDLANQQRQDEQARYADTVARDNARYATATQREDAAIGRQQSQIAADKAVVAPSQARYESTFQPGFTMANDPGYTDALDQSSKATLHALSVNGNPAGSPNAWSQSLTDNYQKTAYPALQAYRNANATTGGFSSAGSGAATIPGIGTNLPAGATAGSGIGTQAGSNTATAAIGQSGTTMADLGGAARDVLAPTTTIDDLLKKLKGAGNIFAVQ